MSRIKGYEPIFFPNEKHELFENEFNFLIKLRPSKKTLGLNSLYRIAPPIKALLNENQFLTMFRTSHFDKNNAPPDPFIAKL